MADTAVLSSEDVQKISGVLLSSDDVAVELGIQPYEAMRLLARGFLKGAVVGDGDDGGWRTTAASLEAYVMGGAKEVELPEAAGDYFDHSLSAMSDAFASAIIQASSEQFTVEGVKNAFRNAPTADSLDFQVQFSGEVKAICSRSVPGNIWLGGSTSGTNAASRFSTWADLYLCETLRNVARGSIQMKSPSAVLWDSLYGSPEAFKAVTDQAYSDLAKRRIVASTAYTVEGRGNPCVAHFLFNLSNIATPAAKSRLIGLAF